MVEFPKRGEIYYIAPTYAEVSTEVWSGRPGIIVSCNQQNKYSNNVMVVYLTTKPKQNYPTNVPINATGKPSTAICDQVNTVAKERLSGDSCYVCTSKELAAVERGIKTAFGFDITAPLADNDAKESASFDVASYNTELMKTRAERDVFKTLYQELLAQTMSVR